MRPCAICGGIFWRSGSHGVPVSSPWMGTPQIERPVDQICKEIQPMLRNHHRAALMFQTGAVGGLKIEGNLVEDDCISFVSQFKIPYLYALTCGAP